MKKTLAILSLVAAAACAGSAVADVITPDASYYNNRWVYLWTPAEGDYAAGSNWDYVKTLGATEVDANTGNRTPSSNDYALIGYTFSNVEGTQKYTSIDTAVSVTGDDWYNKYLFLSGNVSFTNTRSDGYAGFGSGGTNVYVGDYGAASGTIFTLDKASIDATVNFSGNLTMTGDSFSRELVSYNDLFRMNGQAKWDGSGISVIDANGVTLQYSATATDEAGYFYLETSGGVGGAYTVTLKANGTQSAPEPATATLSLLALAGLAARRRRK